MKKKYILSAVLISAASFTFGQNIELPDLTTVISGETVKAGIDALPDFKNVIVIPENSGNVVPVLPDVETPSDSDINLHNGTNAEKTIFAEGLIGGGYPSLFTGNFSVFRLSGNSPFRIAFSHDSAVGYSTHSLSDGFNDRTTVLLVEKGFENEKLQFHLNGGYEALSNGLQSHLPGITSLNQDIYSGAGNVSWNINEIFSVGLGANVNFYNRYADVASGDFPNAAIIDLMPELFAGWSIRNFLIGINAAYTMDKDFSDSIEDGIVHRGSFGLKLQWTNDFVKAYGSVNAVVGNRLNDNSVLVPFTAGVEASVPVSFSNRKISVSLEGGIDSCLNKISELEKTYKFTGLAVMPEETSDWYGKLNLSLPVKDSFTGNLGLEYRKTAYDNGHWNPVYIKAGENETSQGIYDYIVEDMSQFSSDLSLTYHYNIFTVTGGWHSNWMDVPVLEAEHNVSLGVNLLTDDSKWGAGIEGSWNLDDNNSIPLINMEGFARLTSSVRAVINVNDTLKLLGVKERVYAGDYITRSGTVTALLKFFF